MAGGASELHTLKLERRIADLETIVKSFTEALKESSQLLQRVAPRVPRVAIPHERKLQLAADQGWRCADPLGECVLYQIGDGTFTSECLPFHADHVNMWSKTHNNLDIQIVCAMCHNALSRNQRQKALEERSTESEG